MAKDTTLARVVTLAEAKERIMAAFDLRRPMFMWGPPGIGKSELIAGISNGGTLGKCYVIDMRLALMEPTDIRGIPFYNPKAFDGLGAMEWAKPTDFPSEEEAKKYDHIILFLDEMNAAQPATQAAAYQLIQDRAVGTYKLPDNVLIVAAGNRESDRGVAYRMPSPLTNRFVHIELKADYDSWLEWAVDHKIHVDVVGFLSAFPGDLFKFEPTQAARSFPTPRSWTFVSEFCEADLDTSVLADLVSGSVGEGMAGKFMAHRKHAANMPTATDILSGKVKKYQTKEISAQYALTTSLLYRLRELHDKYSVKEPEKWHKIANTFWLFNQENFGAEINVMAGRVALITFKIRFYPQKMPDFSKWSDKYNKFIFLAHHNK